MTRTWEPLKTGGVRLDARTFEELVVGTGAEPDGQNLDVQQLGAATVAGLAAVNNHLARFTLRIATQNTVQAHAGWIGEDNAALLLLRPDGLYDFLALAPPLLPVSLAKLTRMGPRRATKAERDSYPFDISGMVPLLSTDDHIRASSFAGLELPDVTWVWAWDASFSGTAGEEVQSVVIGADGDGGPYRLAPTRSGTVWMPVQARSFWLAFTEFLNDVSMHGTVRAKESAQDWIVPPVLPDPESGLDRFDW